LFSTQVWIEFKPPWVWKKQNPKDRNYELFYRLVGIHERDGPFYLVEHSVSDAQGATINLGRTDWADWCHSGDLLFAQEGKIFRLTFESNKKLASLDHAKVLTISRSFSVSAAARGLLHISCLYARQNKVQART